MEAILIALAVIALFLITQRWLWVLGFALGAIASLFATLAIIIHFQILGAVGFFILAGVLGVVAGALAEE